jgi:hypothetical protein
MVLEVDGRVELSGQSGWHPNTLDFPVGVPIEAEINWTNVAHINPYHTQLSTGAGDPVFRRM